MRGSLEYGKSTITNKILNKQVADTGDISKKNKRGKNTTTDSTLYMIEENSYFLDTPGFQTIDIFKIETKDLDKYFIEFKEHIKKCEFVRMYSHKRRKLWSKKRSKLTEKFKNQDIKII